MKQQLLAHFHATLRALETGLVLRTQTGVGGALQHIENGGDVLLIAFGKAARSMAQSVLEKLPLDRVRGLLVPPEPDAAPLPPLEVIPGGHPLPTAGSFRAAERALSLCRAATVKDHVLFLVSGGGSALLEQPIDGAASIEQWRDFYRALVASGAPIDRVNRIRRRVSDVKGGRLAIAAAGAADRTTIWVSDVPNAQDVASGPTWTFEPEPDTLLDDLREFGLLGSLPPPLRARVERRQIASLPEATDSEARGAWITALDEGVARAALATRLRRDGVVVDDGADVDDEPYELAATHLLQQLDEMHARHPSQHVAIVTSGELSVPLPQCPGIGGRNQQFALACAVQIADRPITVLSCGTDGIDGNSPAAGAVVDGTTMERARRLGLDVHDHLARCDAFPLLQALGDAVITGPTGTNVRDLRVLLHT